MAGHSHSANIAVRKGKQDAQRAKLFSKLARYIMIAAKNGGGDPDTNLRLRYAIDKARSVSMPKDNIERAVKKGTGELEGVNYEDVTYEGYGPGGVAILVEALTDNRARTGNDVRTLFEKGGGNMGTPGCVGYLFDRKGLIVLDVKAQPDEEKMMEAALEAGADDIKREGTVYEITTDPTTFGQVLEKLKAAGYEPGTAELTQLPKTAAEVETEVGKKVVRLLDALEDNDDVQNVYTNANITEEMAG
ncbi:YebC/PmpR family DNA-binding transcriptional regulator [Limnoglobus roseus]|uniref:Probable transcriptional regulatory protein PX52LOC_07057 n=1 Tax=Limnoglobus roseus TaxID=2598579 RepID=A0A5C1APA6_9BACT|nr:YebC/PmpR family DNA-binding transcriptional regulator [Limnoglobus roseus]QEL19973.1 YebC/PmpR family DNA-binding transcriptional regulator [Limnoglobus roseus]